ncbi:MAG: CoA transferase, partial [Dehalococcoidia bacterium]|nr:CoA transferase [Dehalococcoidia bacterium]
ARARGFFGEIDHPQSGRILYPLALAHFSRTPWQPRRAPLLGEHNSDLNRPTDFTRAAGPVPHPASQAVQALEGVRIADFSWAVAGPYSTLLLAFLGAQVIKVESRQRVDVLRKLTRVLGWEDQANVDKSVEFNLVNLNKLGITLDLAHPEGVALAKRLVAASDVVVENFSPGVMENLGLGYEALRRIKPDLIMISISAAGATGPERRSLGYASIFHAAGGLAHLTGYPDSPPGYIRSPIDCNVASAGALAVLAALVHRQATGFGQYIDLSAREVVSYLIGHAFLQVAMNGKDPGRTGNWDSSMAPHDCYPCRGEDRWISIAVGNEEEWQALVRTMKSPSWTREGMFADQPGRLEHREELQRKIGEWTIQYDPFELTELLQRAGVAAFPSLSVRDIYQDAHLTARGWALEVEHPVLGRQVVMGPPWKMSRTPPLVHSPAPTLGQHQHWVCEEVLGLSRAEVEDLQREGAFG